MFKEIKKKAEQAKNKPASFGLDLDLDKFEKKAKPWKEISCLAKLPRNFQKDALKVGITTKESQRSGSFFQLDHSVVFSKTKQKGLEVMDIVEALKKYPWLEKYWWKAVAVDSDKYTAQVELEQTHGYFIRALPKTKVLLPVQACLFLSQEGLIQNLHNIIIAEEGSELQIITGCTISETVRKGLHIGISEFFAKKNSKIIFSMLHSWGPEMDVRPRSAAVVEENGTFVSNYVCLKSVKSLQMYPTTYLVGKNAKAKYNTLIYGCGNSNIDVGSRVILKAENTAAEVTTRVIAKDKSEIIARGHLVGENKNCKAHLECRGLLLSDKARIHSIPELEGKIEGCELSHEAAVGKIRQEELFYLMSRGLTEQEAISMVVKGFLDPEIIGLPENLKTQIKKIIEETIKEF